MEKHFNRASRRSGGHRKFAIPTDGLTRNELEVILQEETIRKEFGEEGVKRFWEEMQKRTDARDADRNK